MNRDADCFRESIRKTFIRYSMVPVVVVAIVVLAIIGFSWTYSVTYMNGKDNKETADKLTKVMNIWYSVLDEVEKECLGEDGNVEKERIYKILYDSCGEYGETGNLVVLSPEQTVLFSSEGDVPYYLTLPQYSEWGILGSVSAAEGRKATALTEGDLCIGKGVYGANGLKYILIYIVPEEVVLQAAGTGERYLAVTDRNGWIYVSNNKKLSDTYGKIAREYDKDTGYIKVGRKVFYLSRTDAEGGLTVYTLDDMSNYIRVIILLIGVIVTVFIGIVIITYKSTDASSEKYTEDIRRIESAFEAVSKGDLDVTLHTGSSREFKTIGNDFNDMLESLKEQIAENRELATDVAFAQLKQLESQLNPHFLFNTLDNIRFMAKIDADAADKMIVSLSGILRYTIRDKREEVTLREDLSNLQYYLNILQIRFNKRFQYRIDIGDDIMDCLIPKLLIQPLLENAIKHGFGEKEKLSVVIRGYQITDKLVFVCEDDGAGISPEKLKEIKDTLENETNETAHYGLYNIHRRIRLMYKGDYGLDIEGKEGEGTLVRIVLPRKFRKNDD